MKFCYAIKVKFLMKVQVMFKSYQIPVLYEMLSFMTMKVVINFGKRFIKKSFLISQDVSIFIQSCRLSDLS